MEIDAKQHAFVVCAHSNTDEKKRTLSRCLKSLKLLDFDIILCSHFDEDYELYQQANYYLFDKEDPVIFYNQYRQLGIVNSIFYENNEYRIDWINKFSHDYSVFRSMQNGFRLAKSLGKKFIHIIEYDCIVNPELFIQELVNPLSHNDVSHSIWDASINNLIATYLFSFRVESLQDLFESINSLEDYYKNKIYRWNLEGVFFDFCNDRQLKRYLNKYPQNLMNLNSIFKQTNLFDELRPCVTNKGELFIHLRTKNLGVKLNFNYNGFNKFISIANENTIFLGTYKYGRDIIIYHQGVIIYRKNLSETVDEFYFLNKVRVKSRSKIYSFVSDGFQLGMRQNYEEIEAFSLFLEKLNVNNFLEIGTDQGGSFLIFNKLSRGIKISIDLPHSKYGLCNFDINNRNKALQTDKNVYLIEADSHDQETLTSVEKILNGKMLDFLFIDGDHSYNGVKRDFELYSKLVKQNGVIAFHDINRSRTYEGELLNVWEFWNSLKGDKIEFKSSHFSGGIGVVLMNENLKLNEDFVKTSATINCHFIHGGFCDVLTDKQSEYIVNFVDSRNNKLMTRVEIDNNCYAKCFYSYFIPYRVQVSNINEGGLIFDYFLDLTNRRVYIGLDSKSLGDTIAWFPYVEEFRLKHKCKIICSTFWNNLFENEYPNIEFVTPGSVVNNIFAMYEVGVFHDKFKEPHDYRKIPLQQISSNILGLEYKEIKPLISCLKNVNKQKLVGISINSTAQAKFWNYPGGWQKIIDYLNQKGFEVVLLQLEDCDVKGVIKPDCRDIKSTISWINKCQFYIGVSSGVSWLAWALNVPVVMISGFTKSFNEFECIRISPKEEICNGCWHEELWDDKAKGDWDWCPRLRNTPRQHECSKTITPEQVMITLKENNLIG